METNNASKSGEEIFAAFAQLNWSGELADRLVQLVAGARWDIVFNVAEGLKGVGREAQVPALLDAYGVPYVFSEPLAMALTLHKGMAKRVVRDLGDATAAGDRVRPRPAGHAQPGGRAVVRGQHPVVHHRRLHEQQRLERRPVLAAPTTLIGTDLDPGTMPTPAATRPWTVPLSSVRNTTLRSGTRPAR